MNQIARRNSAMLAIIVLTICGTAAHAAAHNEKVIHDFFQNGTDGFGVMAPLIVDSAGNLYGTTQGGGSSNYGTVFELTPAGGVWTETILYSFNRSKGGYYPYAPLTFDRAGNLYGTATRGGLYGFGTVFELTPSAGGAWTEKVLHSFNHNGTDGTSPYGGVVLDSAGNIYGMTRGGGDAACVDDTGGCGIVFELTPTATGSWKEKILHTFTSNGDGTVPCGGLAIDAGGNLYGATSHGGAHGYGTVFEIISASGHWNERVLHSFNRNGSDGLYPFATPTVDPAGNVYGTTLAGGANLSCGNGNYGCGTVFELSPNGSGGWRERILHHFAGNGHDGYYPYAGVILDASGNLYGTASTGGNANNTTYEGGTVFVLKPLAGGLWGETILYDFNNATGGSYPQTALVFGLSGDLYGTTYDGGSYGQGTVFELTP